MLFLPRRVTLFIITLIFLLSFLFIPQKTYAEGELRNYNQISTDQYVEDIRKLNDDSPPILDTAIQGRVFAAMPLSLSNLFVDLPALQLESDNLRKNGGKIEIQDILAFKKQNSHTVLGFLDNVMTVTYTNPPASLAWYTQDLLANAGLIQTTQAQGIGYNALLPLLPIWAAIRNVAYGILVIVMVAIGFMIIFRAKIDPKTVITVQAAIPKIIVTLLLITFSYAIAGFMIDLMYVSIALIVALFAPAAGYVTSDLQAHFLTADLLDLWSGIWGGGLQSIPSLFSGLLVIPELLAGGALVTLLIAHVALSPFLGIAILLVVPGLMLLAIILGLLFTSIRMTLLLLNSYIQLLVAVILGPILLLQEAIPGRSAFSGWILNIIANLSVFPATVALLMFAWFLVSREYWNFSSSLPGMGGWGPPLLAGGQLGQRVFPAFLGLGVIFLMPNLVVTVKKIFQPKPTIPISAGTMFSPLTGGISTAMGAASQMYYMKQMLPTSEGAHGIMGTIRKVFGGRT
ncbi:hypothetical protein HYW54_02520 [Candidatus Gottesmanbacteria bacterium]|nr:hypothetical protein [Candidatus Gottesmanbacteria bacterium]